MAKILAFFSLVGALVITVSTSLVIMTHDVVLQNFLQDRICQQMSRAFDCRFKGRLAGIDIIRGRLQLQAVVVTPPAGRDWFWTAQSVTVDWSWPYFFERRALRMRIRCGDMHIATAVQKNKLAIAEHIAAFMREQKSVIPFIPALVELPRVLVQLRMPDGSDVSGTLVGTLQEIDGQQAWAFTLSKDLLAYRDHPLFKDINLQIKKTKGAYTLCGTLGMRDFWRGTFVPVKIEGLYADQKKEISCVGEDQSLRLAALEDGTYHVALNHPLGQLDVVGHLETDRVVFEIRNEAAQAVQLICWYDGNRYSLTGATDFIQTLLHKMGKEYALGSTPFTVAGTRNGSQWISTIDVSQLQTRIPFTYNFLRSAHATGIYTGQHHIISKDLVVTTDRGTIKSGLSTVHLTPDKTGIAAAHIPLRIEDFFINHGKDIFAHIGGACVFDYRPGARSSFVGVATLKKCHIRNNPLSSNMGNALVSGTLHALMNHPFAQGTDINLVIRSRDPVDIKTDFLKAQAQVDVQVTGRVDDPQLFGTIELISGTCNFPYKPLEIQRGKIFFVDNQRDDPAIELTASAAIKNYTITMHVHGSARSPAIEFYATPELQEEQIIGLLLGGSPDRALSLVMPLSSMGMIETLLVGDSQESSGLLDSLKKWLGPLDQVKIVPRFSDQTGRGGLRGALAIEVNDTLSALIQQNFSLSEDTLIEVAYKPTDELTFRGMRDERGDLGGEVEARFTW